MMRAEDEIDIPLKGAWVRWVCPEVQREGLIITSKWPSMIVQWLGVDDPQVFPTAYPHFGPRGDMQVIPRPSNVTRIQRQQATGVLGIAAAAAALGTTPKRVRQRLRDGVLKGEQINGKWKRVYLDA